MQPYITLLIGGVSEELSEFPTLYARSKNGNIRTYLIEVVDFEGYSLIRTTKKANLQGKEVVDETIVNSGVNLGKANATTYQEQARLQARSMYKRLLDAEFKITDVIEASGRDAGTAIFVCECEGGYFNVKPQGTRELRKEYFINQDKLIGKMVTVQYQGLSDEGIPRFPSAITIRDYE